MTDQHLLFTLVISYKRTFASTLFVINNQSYRAHSSVGKASSIVYQDQIHPHVNPKAQPCLFYLFRGLRSYLEGRNPPNMPQALLYKWEKNSGLGGARNAVQKRSWLIRVQITNVVYARLSYPAQERRRPALGYMKKYVQSTIGRSFTLVFARCRKSAELHDKRHREIASLLLKIKNIDDSDERVLGSVPNGKRKHRTRDILDIEYLQDSHSLERTGEDDEWADSSTLNDEDQETRRPGILGMKENYTPGRTRKAERKQARSSSLLQVVTPPLMNKIDASLHPESHTSEDKSDGPGDVNGAALSHEIIQDNLAFNTGNFEAATMRQSIHAKRAMKSNGIGKISSKTPRNEAGMAALLGELGVVPISRPSKERAALMKQLKTAIRDDIDKVENENRDTMMRMAGYWRYVNRKTYNFMVRNNQIWDWTTGQKLEEIEEEEESELNMDVEHTTLWDDASSTVGTSRSGAGTPLEVEDQKSVAHFDDTNFCQMIGRTEKQDMTSAVEFCTRNPGPKGTTERPSSPVTPPGKDLRHYEIPAAIATHKFEEPLPRVSPLPTHPTSQPLSNNRNSFSPPHHDRNNRYDSLESLKGGLNGPLGRTSTIRVLKLPSTSGETMSSWTTVKKQGPRRGKPTYADALKKRAQ
ncbi:MAG: hypothetical protein Q9226_000767 [Calogaya cf. arnoldii]